MTTHVPHPRREPSIPVDTTAWHRAMVRYEPFEQHLLAELLGIRLAREVSQAAWDDAVTRTLAMLDEEGK